MARKRTIDPEIWSDDKITQLTDVRSYLLYLGCISIADDLGRFEWSSRQLWARLFPTREDVKLADVQRWMDDLIAVGLLESYEVGGRTYALHPKWANHQYVSRPSKSRIPAPFEHESSARRAESVRTKSAQYLDFSRTTNEQKADEVRGDSGSLSCSSDTGTDTDTDTGTDIREVEAAASPAPKPRMVRPPLPEVAADAFGAAEADVAIFVAAAAAENKTGAISTGRIESIRRELLAAREEFPSAFLAALREANARGKPSVNYVRAICKGRAKAPLLVVRPETIIDEALPDYLLDAIEQHDKDFGVAS